MIVLSPLCRVCDQGEIGVWVTPDRQLFALCDECESAWLSRALADHAPVDLEPLGVALEDCRPATAEEAETCSWAAEE